MKQYINGEYITTIKLNPNKQTLKQKIDAAKRARRDARLVMILTK